MAGEVVAGEVVVFTGLPGTGKSTLAELLAVRIGAPAFSGDWLMGALKPAHSVLADLDRDSYLDLHRSLLESLITRQCLLGQSAVVDALVDDGTLRRWEALAAERAYRWVVVHCVCSDLELHRSRVEGRVRGIPGWHEIDWDHVERMRTEVPPPGDPTLVLDAVEAVETNLAEILAYLGR